MGCIYGTRHKLLFIVWTFSPIMWVLVTSGHSLLYLEPVLPVGDGLSVGGNGLAVGDDVMAVEMAWQWGEMAWQ